MPPRTTASFGVSNFLTKVVRGALPCLLARSFSQAFQSVWVSLIRNDCFRRCSSWGREASFSEDACHTIHCFLPAQARVVGGYLRLLGKDSVSSLRKRAALMLLNIGQAGYRKRPIAQKRSLIWRSSFRLLFANACAAPAGKRKEKKRCS